jgi:uncharacterized protein (DUF3084 family)
MSPWTEGPERPETNWTPRSDDGSDFESTSARLRRVEQERHLSRAELATARAELGHLRRERDHLRAELTAALDEIEQLHGPREAS